MASIEEKVSRVITEDGPGLPSKAEVDIEAAEPIKSKELSDTDEFLVGFAKPSDPENPQDWSRLRKWQVTGVLSATGFNRIMVSTIMAPAITTIQTELSMSSTEAVMTMSVYLLASAFGPLIIGPMSEIYGRRSIIHITNLWFLLWNFVCGFAKTKGVLIAARLLAGFGASAVYSLGYGVLADVWAPEQRGRSLSLYLLFPLLAAAVGPIIGGFITEYTTWRWMFWATSCVQAVLAVISIPIFHETYAPLILRRKAERLRKETGDSRHVAPLETKEEGRSISWKLKMGLTRPLRLLFLHPIIQIQAILCGLNYGLLYFALSSFATLWTTAYGESASISGLHYLSLFLGEILGSLLCGPLMDHLYVKLKSCFTTSDGSSIQGPELRIPLLLPGAIVTPIGLFIYGWAAEKHVFWLVVDVGAAVLALGMQSFGFGLQAYIMDAYSDHVGSASAATQLFRSLAAFAFPLFAPRMYAALGYGWGNSLLAFLSLGIGLPATAVLWRYGAKLRAKRPETY